MATNTGDRPRYGLPNQRLGKNDLYDLIQLQERKFLRLVGNLVGPTWGCFTAPTFDLSTYAATQRILVGACVLGYVWESALNGSLDFEGGPVIYDPTNRTIQSESSVFVPSAWNNTNVWLWFQRGDGPSATDMRRHMPASVEAVAPTNTRYDEFVLFRATNQNGVTADGVTLSEDTGWFRFAKIRSSSWAAGVPTIVEPIDFYSGWYLRAMGAAPFSAMNTWSRRVMGSEINGDPRWGLAQHLQAVLNQLAQVKDGDVVVAGTDTLEGSAAEASATWDSEPDISLKEVAAALDAIGTSQDMATLAVQWNSASSVWVVVGEALQSGVTGASVVTGGSGDGYPATVSLTIATGWTVLGCHVQSLSFPSDPDGAIPFTVAVRPGTRMPFAANNLTYSWRCLQMFYSVIASDYEKNQRDFTFVLKGKRTA